MAQEHCDVAVLSEAALVILLRHHKRTLIEVAGKGTSC
jgi:hypothetical protein